MTADPETSGYEIRHSADFAQVYNLDDPRPYYEPLMACDYRMPEHLTSWLLPFCCRRAMLERLNGRQKVEVLDLACGYGANGANILHDLLMEDVYDHYLSRRWAPSVGRDNWAGDAAFFATARWEDPFIRLAGLDVAPTAIEYALATGLVDVGFTDDLAVGPPGAELTSYLDGVDLVIESGAIGSIYVDCFEAILNATSNEPWFAYSPRPNVDQRPIDELWKRHGYTARTVTEPLRYRQTITELERQVVFEQTLAAGNDPYNTNMDGYLEVRIHVAKPSSEAWPPQ